MSEQPPVQRNQPKREAAPKPEAETHAESTHAATPTLESAPTQQLIDENKKRLEVVARLNANKPESVSDVEAESGPKNNEGNIESNESREGEPGNKDKHNKEKIKGKDGHGKEKHQDPHEKGHTGAHGKERGLKYKVGSAVRLGVGVGAAFGLLYGESEAAINILGLSPAVHAGLVGIGFPTTGFWGAAWLGPASAIALGFFGTLVKELWSTRGELFKSFGEKFGVSIGGGSGGGKKGGGKPAAAAAH